MNTRREPEANQNGNQEDDWKRYSVAVVGRVEVPQGRNV